VRPRETKGGGVGGGISLVEISPSLGPQSPRNNVAGFALWLTLDNLFSPPNTSFHTQKGVFYIWTDRQGVGNPQG
jgi:hypothetical protein